MDSRTSQKSSKPVQTSGRSPKKRFRIQKLEERIAPKTKGGGAQTSSGLSWGTPSIY
jgi:hypothetical protein